ncbi:MAG: pirin family protein, partial [Oscillospiraceae bacterium]
MATRKIVQMVTGQRAVDGAGVHLVRVLGHDTTEAFDPFLMLDSFDSKNPEDYVKGFPTHPHRGIETVTYLIHGEIDHQDSLGNKGVIGDGQSQWMTAGSGIMHQEMPQPSPEMLGFQLWLNLPQAEKMTLPKYFDITPAMMEEEEIPGGTVRVISGQYGGAKGVKPHHIQASIYDVKLAAGAKAALPTTPGETVFVFLIKGGAVIEGKAIAEKTAVLFGEGDGIEVSAEENAPARFLFFSAPPLHEGIAWGGPIVMTTRAELQTAFDELRQG